MAIIIHQPMGSVQVYEEKKENSNIYISALLHCKYALFRYFFSQRISIEIYIFLLFNSRFTFVILGISPI